MDLLVDDYHRKVRDSPPSTTLSHKTPSLSRGRCGKFVMGFPHQPPPGPSSPGPPLRRNLSKVSRSRPLLLGPKGRTSTRDEGRPDTATMAVVERRRVGRTGPDRTLAYPFAGDQKQEGRRLPNDTTSETSGPPVDHGERRRPTLFREKSRVGTGRDGVG